jgi:tetratricopeptide (TPR) repeat protein
MKTNKKYTIITLLSLIALLIVLAGIFYFMQNKKEKISDDIEINKEEGLDDSLKGGDTKTNDVVVDDVNKDKFNLAIKNAREASLKKDYVKTVEYYTEALKYKNSDIAYAGLYSTYLIEGNLDKAKDALDTAIKLNPTYTEYYQWKLDFLNEKMGSSFAELKEFYNKSLSVVDARTKINMITYFARMAENKGEKTEALNLWKKASEVYPDNKDIYQAEIDRLSN